MASGGGGGDTTTTNEPWAGQQPYLVDLMQQAQNQYYGQQGGQFYPRQTVAPFSDPTQMALTQMVEQGRQGTAIRQPMEQFLGASLANPAAMAGVGTDMPGMNPWLDPMVGNVGRQMGEQFAQYTAPTIAAQFGGAGRTGSHAHQQALAQGAQDFMTEFGDVAADIYGRDYEQALARDVERRGLMGDIGFRGATMAPQLQQMQFADTGQLAAAGGAIQDQWQNLINADRERFEYQRDYPMQSLANYASIVQGMPQFSTSTTTGPGGNPLLGGLGGAAAGAGLAGSVAALNPYTAPLAIGGGLLGLLG